MILCTTGATPSGKSTTPVTDGLLPQMQRGSRQRSKNSMRVFSLIPMAAMISTSIP